MAQPNPPRLRFLDGGMGTYLEDQHNIVFDASKPAWSSSVDPSLLQAVHEEYARSGADILLTATYQATAANMASGHGSSTLPTSGSRGDNGNGQRRLLELVKTCAGASTGLGQAWKGSVALSLGPYGATMVPSTEYSGAYEEHMARERALRGWHLGRLRDYACWDDMPEEYAAAWEAVSIVAFETLVSAVEVRAVRGAMFDLHGPPEQRRDTGRRRRDFWVSVNFPNGTASEPLTPRMETAEAVGRAMFEAGEGLERPQAVGVNCTKMEKVDAVVRGYEAALQSMEEASGVGMQWPALVIYPDGAHNLRYNTSTKTWEPIDEQAGAVVVSWATQMEAILRKILGRGRWSDIVLGGCCKTTPDDIAELCRKCLACAASPS